MIVQAETLGANSCASIVITMLEAISNAHENLAKVFELLPKLLLSVSALFLVSAFKLRGVGYDLL